MNKSQGLVEYAIIIILVALAVIILLALFGQNLGGVYSNIINSI